MASDYDKITQENIRKRGEEFDDIGEFLAEQLYSDRTHFVYELLQNAEDALGRRLAREGGGFRKRSVEFRLFQDRLELRHYGEPFDEKDVEGLCDVLRGTKAEDEEQIGKFGIGFKSVYAYTSSPEVYSGEEHFRIERYIRPHAVAPHPLRNEETLFVFPFNHPKVSAAEAFAQIRGRLASLDLRTLLFLRNVDGISWSCEDAVGGSYVRQDADDGDARRLSIVGEREDGSGTRQEDWLVFERRVEGASSYGTGRVEAAFRLASDERSGREVIVPTESSELVVFFPTEKETHLKFLIQGPYKTTPARDNIVSGDEWNDRLVEETANLVVEALPKIRDRGLLTADFLQVLPIDPAYFAPGSQFYPVFDRVREALSTQDLLPAHSGHFVSARAAKLAGTAGLRELVPDEQLDRLLGSGVPLRWLSGEITVRGTPNLRQYLMRVLGVEEITPDAFARRLGPVFLKHQTDEWMISLYRFFDENRALWRPRSHPGQEIAPLRNRAFVRLQDLSHVPPFYGDDKTPRAFLPVEDTDLPTVRREVAADPQALKFLVNLGFTGPDIVDEVIEQILPKYGPKGGLDIDDSEHERDLSKIAKALGTDSVSKKAQLAEKLRATRFLIASNAATGETAFRRPGSVYLDVPQLAHYFEGNPAVWFLDERYAAFENELLKLGVSAHVRVRCEMPDVAGYVSKSYMVSNYERGLNGFDPDSEIDGLEHALKNVTPEKATYIWNTLLIPNAHLVRGVVEKATWRNFGNARLEEGLSKMGALVAKHAWLPDPEGVYKKPRELGLDDLPDVFVKDENLAEVLGMRPSDVALLADRLGLSSQHIDFLVKYPEKFEAFIESMKEKEHEEEPVDGPDEGEQETGAESDLDFAEELETAFTKPAGNADEDSESHVLPGIVGNPELRRKRLREEIEKSKREEPEKRFVRVPRKVWEAKNYEVRTFLREQYDGRCQICSSTFRKRDGEPYFEGLYMVSSTKAGWIDRPGSVLCLCATCCAKFQHGEVETEEGVLEQITSLRTYHEGGNGEPVLHIRLCGEDEKVRFSEQHLVELQVMVEEE